MVDALVLARRHGVGVELRGDRLQLHAPSEPPPHVLTALRQHKAGIIVALTSPVIESVCMVCGRSAGDTDSNTVRDNPTDTVLRRVHHPPACYDEFFLRAFGRLPKPANIN